MQPRRRTASCTCLVYPPLQPADLLSKVHRLRQASDSFGVRFAACPAFPSPFIKGISVTQPLAFDEGQLCELWMRHARLEDDPRDANRDLRVSFDESDKFAIVAFEHAAPPCDAHPAFAFGSDTFRRIRSEPDCIGSPWAPTR
jgi:hypothetical protein